MRFNIAKTLVCAAALVALSAQAQGPYVGGSIGGTKYKGDDIGGLATDRTSTGGKLYGGYAFNPHIALELGYADLGKFSSPAGSVKGKGVFLDGVGTIPITQSLSALGRVGVFNGKLDTTLAAVVAQPLVQHEAALGLHRPAEVHRRLGQVVAVECELDLLEQVLQLDVDRLIDHEAERTLLGVLAHVDHASGEGVARHARHSDQKLVREVDAARGHGAHFRTPTCGRHDLSHSSPAPPPGGGSSKAHVSPKPPPRGGLQHE